MVEVEEIEMGEKTSSAVRRDRLTVTGITEGENKSAAFFPIDGRCSCDDSRENQYACMEQRGVRRLPIDQQGGPHTPTPESRIGTDTLADPGRTIGSAAPSHHLHCSLSMRPEAKLHLVGFFELIGYSPVL